MKRWGDLRPQEMQIIYFLIVKDMKLEAIAQEVGLSRNRVAQILMAAYRVLGVSGQLQLAFEVGKNWTALEPKLLSSAEGQ